MRRFKTKTKLWVYMSVFVSAYVRVPSTRDLVNGSIPITLYYNICLFIQSCLLMSFYCIIITINRDDDLYRNVLYVCTYKKEIARERVLLNFVKFQQWPSRALPLRLLLTLVHTIASTVSNKRLPYKRGKKKPLHDVSGKVFNQTRVTAHFFVLLTTLLDFVRY